MLQLVARGILVTKSASKHEKAKAIQKILDKLYPEPPIPLQHYSPFTLCIAVLLSAQTTDKAVNLVTPALFKLADTPQAMIQLTIPQIQNLIKTIGLAPTKAKAIWNLSRLVIDQFNGELPKTFAELETLPGVGHKTASVVMSQAYGFPAFPVDTHIHRLAHRWGLSRGKTVEQTEKDLKAIFLESSWNKLHLQIIYYGREYCPARTHDLKRCFICKDYGVASVLRREEKLKSKIKKNEMIDS